MQLDLRKYRISANSFRGNYSFLNLSLCTVTFSVTLLLEMQHKEFTSDKPIYLLQFGTIIHIMGLSLTFKTIK